MGGGKTGTTTQSVQVPPEVLARYQSVNAQAQAVAQTPFQQYSSDPNAFVAPMTAAQNYGLQQTSNYANAAQPGIAQAEGLTQQAASGVTPQSLNTQAYMNPYEANVIAPTAALMQQQFGQAQSGALGNAVQSGAYGGDRAGIAAANLQQQQGLAYGQAMGNLLNQNYAQALGAAQQQQGVNLGAQQFNRQQQLAAGNQLGNLAQAGQQAGLAGAQALMGAGQAQQQTQQAGLTALYNQFLQQQSYPFQTAQFLANIAEGTGALSGQTTSTTQPMPFFSDRRLKENIREIGKAKNGLPIYSFRYKHDPEKLTRIGFMADDVEDKHPEAVGLAGGYKTVDYDRAARSSGGLVGDLDQGEAYDRGGFDAGGFVGAPGYDPMWSNIMNAEEGMYGRSEGGLYGSSASGAPYGGKARVPAASLPQHHMLQPGPMPHQQQGAGAQALQGLSQLEKLYGTGKNLQSMGHGLVAAVAPSPAAPAPAHADGAAPPDGAAPAQTPASSGDSTPAPSNADTSDLASAADDGGGLAGDLSDVFAARGGYIGRDAGGLVAGTGLPSMVNAPAQAEVYDAVARQNAMPTWSGPFARGGVTGRGHFDTGGAPAAGLVPQGPDVVSPTSGYLQGLGEAQAAQDRANQVDQQINQRMAAAGATSAPDLTPFGQLLDRQGLLGSLGAYGTTARYTNPAYSGSLFADGGLVGRAHRGAGGSLDAGAWNSADQEYQDASDPNSTQDTTKLGIPDEQPNVQQIKPSTPPSQSGSGDGLGAISKGIGALTGILGLVGLAAGGSVDDRRRRADGGTDDGTDLVPVPDTPDALAAAIDPNLTLPQDYVGEIDRMPQSEGLSAPVRAEGLHSFPRPNDVGTAATADASSDPLAGASGLAPSPYGALPSAADVAAANDASSTTAGQSTRNDPYAMDVTPEAGLAGATGLRSAAGLAPDASAATADVPLPPERPADLGGLAAAATAPTTPDDSNNPIVNAGRAVTGALTHGVEGAGRAIGAAGTGVSNAVTGSIQNAARIGTNFLHGAEGFRAKPYWDGNAYRVGFGSDTVTDANGNVHQVVPGMHITAADAERDLQRRFQAEFLPRARTQVGSAFDSLSPAAQAMLGSVAYNYGSLPGSVVAAARTGDPNALANAVGSLSANPRRRAQEAQIIRNGAMSNTSDNQNAADNALRIAASPTQRAFQANGDGAQPDMGGGNVLQQAGEAVTHAGQGAGDWFGQNRSWIIPLLSGLGGMASSNSRYLGSAILQGLGSGAQAYAGEQQNQAQLANTQAENEAIRARTAGTQAGTEAQLMRNAQTVPVMRDVGNGVHVLVQPITDGRGHVQEVPYADYMAGKLPPGWRAMNAGELAQYGGQNGLRSAPPTATSPATFGSQGSVTPGVTAAGGAAAPGVATPSAITGAMTSAAAAPTGGYATVQPTPSPAGATGPAAEGIGRVDPVLNATGADFVKKATEGATEANTNMAQMHTLAQSVANLNMHPGATGAGGEKLANLGKAIGRVGDVLGIPGLNTSGVLSEPDVLHKFQTMIAGVRAQGLNQHSYSALEDFANALPGMNLTPRANAEIMANLLMLSQVPRDMATHANTYLQQEKGSPVTHTYAGVIPSYQQKYSAEQYGNMANALTKLFATQPKLANGLLNNGDPQFRNPAFRAAILRKYGYDPAIDRVFQ